MLGGTEEGGSAYDGYGGSNKPFYGDDIVSPLSLISLSLQCFFRLVAEEKENKR